MSDEIEATQPGVEPVEIVAAHEGRLNAIEAIASGMMQDEPEAEQEDKVETVEEEVTKQPEEEVKTRTLKVEGEEVERTEDEIIEAGIRALQKESSADKRLEEATQLLKEAKEQQNLQPPSVEAVVTQEDQPPIVDAETMHKIQYGTEEESRLALEGVLRAAQVQPTPQPQPNVEAIVQTELDRRGLVTKLEAEFPEVFGDPRLLNMAKLEIDDKLKAGSTGDYETYQEVLTGLMEWRGTKKEDGMNERQEKKSAASVTSIKTASATKSVEPEEKPQTTQDVINEMARQRGQMT
jgi:hypothetical protein